MNNKIKGDNYEIFIRNYLLSSDFSDHDNVKDVWLWKDTPINNLYEANLINDFNESRLKRKTEYENPFQDKGIDIIRFDKDNKYTFVQCKDYKNNICIDNLGGFPLYMASHEDKIGEFYYTNSISNSIKEIINNNKRLKFIRKPIDKVEKEIINKKIRLYDYQKKIYKTAIKYYKNNKSGYITMPCGTGKTYVSYRISSTISNLIIFIVPLKEHAQQIISRIEEYSKNQYKCILVDSDGLRDHNEIYKILSKNEKVFISSTYKSVDVINELLNKYEINPFIIVDEFHNLSNNNINNTKDDFYKIINNEKYKKLYLSATPRFYELENTENNVETKYILGDEIYNMSFNDAINDKLITDYRILLPYDIKDDTQYNEIKEELNMKINYELSKKCCFLYEGIKRYGNLKCIVYCQDTKQMKSMMKTMNELNKYFYYKYYINYITCEVNKEERKKRIEEFSNYDGISFLFSVDILNECIDIPACNSIYITYNSNSKIKTIQRICRAMRIDKNYNRKIANIFVWCDEIDNCVSIISAIKEYDTSYYQKINLLNIDNKLRKTNEIKIINEKNLESCKKFIMDIKEFRQISWHNNLELIREYLDQNNKNTIATLLDYNKGLYKWMEHQLYNHKNEINIMKNVDIKNLYTEFLNKYQERFNFKNEEIRISNFKSNLNKVIQYLDEKQENNITTLKKYDESLSKWICDNNLKYKNDLYIMKNPDIKNLYSQFLEKYKSRFNFKNDNIFITEWKQKLNSLEEYFNENENNNILTLKEHNQQLHTWYYHQYNNYKNDKKLMTKDEIKNIFKQFLDDYNTKLNDNIKNREWKNKLNKVIEYLNQNENNRIETLKSYDISLYRWFNRQNDNYDKKTQIMESEYIRNIYKQFLDNNSDKFNFRKKK